MFTPSFPADHFSAPNALVCPRKMAVLRPKMTRKQTRYHGNETTALRKLLFITRYWSKYRQKDLRGRKTKA